MINTGNFKMFGALEDMAATGDVEAFVFRNGEVVPANQVNDDTGPVIHTAPEKNFGTMEDLANGNASIEEFVFSEGRVVPINQAEHSSAPCIHTPPEKNFAAYWYEKENGSLLAFEKACYFQFMREYNHPQQRLSFSFDNKRRFCVDIDLPFKAAPEVPWRLFKFHIVYEHDHPGRDADGYFGGSIKVYPMTRIKPGFHHMISDPAMGCPHICQVRTVNSEEVNGYKALTRVLRWIEVYSIWEKTGVDIDK